MAIKCAFISLGCPKNQVDSEVMLAKLNAAGIEIVPEDIDADVVVINTCAFIESAKKEAIETILDVEWLRENRNLKGIVVCGCLAQRYKDELFAEMPEVDALIGVGDLEHIVEAVEAAYKNGGKKDLVQRGFVPGFGLYEPRGRNSRKALGLQARRARLDCRRNDRQGARQRRTVERQKAVSHSAHSPHFARRPNR